MFAWTAQLRDLSVGCLIPSAMIAFMLGLICVALLAPLRYLSARRKAAGDEPLRFVNRYEGFVLLAVALLAFPKIALYYADMEISGLSYSDVTFAADVYPEARAVYKIAYADRRITNREFDEIMAARDAGERRVELERRADLAK